MSTLFSPADDASGAPAWNSVHTTATAPLLQHHSAEARPLRGAGRSACAALAAAMSLLFVAEAHAAKEPHRAAVRLQMARDPGVEACPDEAFLRAEVARRLGADPFQDDAERVLTVHIAREGPELTASMALRDREGETQWAEAFGTRSGCEQLLSGVALAIVAQLLGVPEQASPPPAPSPPPPQAHRAAPAPPRPAEPPQAPPQPDRLRLEAGLGATLGLGITPGAAAGMTLSLGVRWSDWSVAMEGRGLVSLAHEVEAVPLRTSAFTAAAVACLRGRRLFGCGVATAGVVRFVPRDPWNLVLRDDAMFHFGARLGSDWPLSDRWSAYGFAEATVVAADAVLRRQGDPHESPGALTWSSPPLTAAVGLGITATY
ncbi:hypothetical protein WMF04_20170 [Sorangium sp. So ce260]|uniref:hypothetical protein n=1 Tax=Sorangium sp. So ce260 TaxID=3133291 RepID=UPI003F6298A3